MHFLKSTTLVVIALAGQAVLANPIAEPIANAKAVAEPAKLQERAGER